MKSTEMVNIEVSEGLIKPLVEEKIRTAIVAEMSKHPQQIIDGLVARALDLKVDEKGKPSTYSSAKPYIEHLCDNVIRDEAKKALLEMIEEHRPKIKDSIKKKMSQGGVSKRLATALVDGMVDSLDCKYSQKIEVSFKKKDDDF